MAPHASFLIVQHHPPSASFAPRPWLFISLGPYAILCLNCLYLCLSLPSCCISLAIRPASSPSLLKFSLCLPVAHLLGFLDEFYSRASGLLLLSCVCLLFIIAPFLPLLSNEILHVLPPLLLLQ
eukprot:c22802_g1_i1 orf=201-572(-)